MTEAFGLERNGAIEELIRLFHPGNVREKVESHESRDMLRCLMGQEEA